MHSFYYIFRFTFTAAPASLTVVRKRTDYTRNKSSRECKFPRTFVHRSESSRVLSFLGAKVPTGNFSWLRSENTGERKVLIPFTDVCLSLQQIVLVHMKRIQKLFCSVAVHSSVRSSARLSSHTCTLASPSNCVVCCAVVRSVFSDAISIP